MTIILGIFGLVMGSFLNVVISRLASGESVIGGRSHCPHCGKILSWFELIPIASFLIQAGQCRSCQNPISLRYPIVEAVSAILFLFLGLWASRGLLPLLGFGQPLAFLGFGFQLWEFLVYAFFGSSLLAISVYDFEHLLIPRQILLPLAVIGLVIVIARFVLAGSLAGFFVSIAGAVSAYIFFSAIWFFSKGRAMGLGDAELALVIGFWLGSWLLIPAIILAFWSGALAGLAFMIFKKVGLKSRIPFGPFLALGALVSLFGGSGIIRLYFSIGV